VLDAHRRAATASGLILAPRSSGNSDVFRGRGAIPEMAKEPRLSRRVLSALMAETIKKFPENAEGFVTNLLLMPSFFPRVGHVFLQLFHDKPGDFDIEYRPSAAICWR